MMYSAAPRWMPAAPIAMMNGDYEASPTPRDQSVVFVATGMFVVVIDAHMRFIRAK